MHNEHDEDACYAPEVTAEDGWLWLCVGPVVVDPAVPADAAIEQFGLGRLQNGHVLSSTRHLLAQSERDACAQHLAYVRTVLNVDSVEPFSQLVCELVELAALPGSREQQLAAILAAYDPIELIRGGAPLDEYLPEARTILPRLPELPEGRIQGSVFEEFTRWFGSSSGALVDYAPVARAIAQWVRISQASVDAAGKGPWP